MLNVASARVSVRLAALKERIMKDPLVSHAISAVLGYLVGIFSALLGYLVGIYL